MEPIDIRDVLRSAQPKANQLLALINPQLEAWEREFESSPREFLGIVAALIVVAASYVRVSKLRREDALALFQQFSERSILVNTDRGPEGPTS